MADILYECNRNLRRRVPINKSFPGVPYTTGLALEIAKRRPQRKQTIQNSSGDRSAPS